MLGFAKRFLAGVIIFAVAVCICSRVYAESLSDLDWQSFTALGGTGEVKTQTDPFAQGVTTAGDLTIEELQLSGIVFKDDDDAYALVSGYLVKPGDHIAGYRVDLIEKDKVRLRRVDDIFILALGGGI